MAKKMGSVGPRTHVRDTRPAQVFGFLICELETPAFPAWGCPEGRVRRTVSCSLHSSLHIG